LPGLSSWTSWMQAPTNAMANGMHDFFCRSWGWDVEEIKWN
jgi:hypothetical protein